MNEFNISFQLEQKDWYAFQKYFLDNSKRFKKTKLVVSLMMPTLFLILAVNDILSKGLITPMVWIYGVTAVISAIFLPRWLTKRTIMKAMGQFQENDPIFGDQSLTLTNSSIKHEIGDQKNTTSWSEISSIEFSKAHFFLINKNNGAIIIPFHLINDSLEDIRDFLYKKQQGIKKSI